VTPVADLKVRWKWKRLMPAAVASASRSGSSSAASISRQALAIAAARSCAGDMPSGRQRLQARNPAASAAAGSA
jgi:hypothetical protein